MRCCQSIIAGLLGALFLSALPGSPVAGAEQVPSEATAPEVGALAPDFVLPDLNGAQVRLADYRGKKVVFLNFWAPWCTACRFEMPTMTEVYQRFTDQGLEILAISIDQGSRQSTVDYAVENRLPFPVLLDPRQEVMERYRVTFIPTQVLIDRQGRMRHISVGPKNWRQPDTWRVLEPLLKEPC
jgi:peroxiredoxin